VGIFTPLGVVFVVIHLVILVVCVAALVDAAIRPAPAYLAAGKLTKPGWVTILAVALLLSWVGFLTFVSLVAAIVYFVDVRPRVREFGQGPRMGPYGPW